MYYVLRTVTLPCRDALSYKAGQPTHALAWCEPYQIFEERASHFIGQDLLSAYFDNFWGHRPVDRRPVSR